MYDRIPNILCIFFTQGNIELIIRETEVLTNDRWQCDRSEVHGDSEKATQRFWGIDRRTVSHSALS